MPDGRFDPRERLVQRIRVLPADQLLYVEQLLAHLECGDSSPLWTRRALQTDNAFPLFPRSAIQTGDGLAVVRQRGPKGRFIPAFKRNVVQSGDESPHSKSAACLRILPRRNRRRPP